MQIERADKHQIESRRIKNSVYIFDGLTGLDLNSDQNFVICLRNIFGVIDKPETNMRNQTTRPAIPDGWVTGKTDDFSGFLRCVNHRHDDSLSASIQRLF